MSSLTVYPTKASALGMKHPHGHPLTARGTTWPRDAFTGRRLRDGSVTDDQAKAFVSDPRPEVQPAPEPAQPSAAVADGAPQAATEPTAETSRSRR